ncbi:MAG: insulinase family protein, partial [Chitinivibrionales bacterium]|nr:insulinase family protein [Chitinivibrionales bacterium]
MDILENITEITLPNKLKLICLKKSDAPVVSVQLWFKTGSKNERDGIRGISHVLEHMMFRGSKNVASVEHSRRIEEVGGNCNAFTSEDATVFIDNIPSSQLEMVLTLEADRMINLSLDPQIFETERKVIIEEYHSYMNNPVSKALLEFRSLYFNNFPYKISPLGTLDDLCKMSVDDVRNYYETWYNPENLVVAIVGDFKSIAWITESFEKTFGLIESKCTVSHKPQLYEKPFSFIMPESISMKRSVDFDVPIIMLGFPAPRYGHKDCIALDILQIILSQGESSHFYRELVRKQSLVLMASGINHFLQHAGLSLFFAVFTPNVAYSKVERALNSMVVGMSKRHITTQEITKVRAMTLTNRVFDLFSAEHICNRLGYNEAIDGNYRGWVEKLELLKNISYEQLVATANTYWNERWRYVLCLKPKKVNRLLFFMGLLNYGS